MTAIDIKAQIRERKRLRKLGLLDQPAPPVTEPVGEHATGAEPEPDDSGPPTEDAYRGRVWPCRVCQTRHRSPHIPAGWLSIARWPPDRERLGPITTVFCSPACARTYLARVEANGANVTYPTTRKAAA